MDSVNKIIQPAIAYNNKSLFEKIAGRVADLIDIKIPTASHYITEGQKSEVLKSLI